MTENVQSIGQNGQIQASAGDIFRVQEERINLLRERVRELEEAAEREPMTLEEALGNLQPDEDYEPVYEIRRVTHKDFTRLVGMVRKVRNHEGLQNALSAGHQLTAMNEAFTVLLDELEGEFLPWLKDLAQVADKDDEELDFGFTFDALNALKNNANFLGALRSATYFVMTGKRLFGR